MERYFTIRLFIPKGSQFGWWIGELGFVKYLVFAKYCWRWWSNFFCVSSLCAIDGILFISLCVVYSLACCLDERINHVNFNSTIFAAQNWNNLCCVAEIDRIHTKIKRFAWLGPFHSQTKIIHIIPFIKHIKTIKNIKKHCVSSKMCVYTFRINRLQVSWWSPISYVDTN